MKDSIPLLFFFLFFLNSKYTINIFQKVKTVLILKNEVGLIIPVNDFCWRFSLRGFSVQYFSFVGALTLTIYALHKSFKEMQLHFMSLCISQNIVYASLCLYGRRHD